MAFEPPVYTYKVALVTKIVDGDTIDVHLDVGFESYVHKRLRFLGIDTYETRGDEREQGLLAKARLTEIIAAADRLYVQTVMDGEGKYGRVLATLWSEIDGVLTDVNRQLIVEGHGVEYMV